MRRFALQTLVFLCGFLLGVLAFGALLGDADDHFWWHGALGAAPTVLLYPHLKNWTLPRFLSRTLQWVFATLAIAMLIESVTGLFYPPGVLSGRTYDEMDGMIPFLLGLGALLPLAALLLVRSIPQKRSAD